MSLNPIGNIFSNRIDPANSVQSGTSTPNVTQTASNGQDQVAFSDFLKVVQQLKQLQTQDPTAFKKELTDIASKLKTAAQQDSDPSQASFLSNLSDRFQKAADTGDLSALNPQNAQGTPSQHGGGHHHHHHGGPQLSAQTTDTLASIFQSVD